MISSKEKQTDIYGTTVVRRKPKKMYVCTVFMYVPHPPNPPKSDEAILPRPKPIANEW